MKLNKFTVVLAILLVSILAIGAVSAESVDDAGIVAVADGDIQDSVEVTDTVDDLSTANNADETVGDGSSAVLGDTTNSYDLNDDTYSHYFNEDGTATDVISESSDYTLVIDKLNNKDIKITYGSHINIIGKEGSGSIKNGTIFIGSGSGEAGSITISGLTFTNNNKDGIYVNDLTTDLTIKDNKFNLTFDDSLDNARAIVTYGYVNGVSILNNDISMNSDLKYTYGIAIWLWTGPDHHALSNPEELLIADNNIQITSTSTVAQSMAEGMYLDNIANSVVRNNTLYIKTTSAGVANYGIQVADSYAWTDYSEPVNSPHNVTIMGNDVVLESADMAYGITVIALCAMDMVEYDDEFVINNSIIGNNVNITSDTGAIGIGLKSPDSKVTDNEVTIAADVTKDIQCKADPEFGDESAAIFINNYNDISGPLPNNVVTSNSIMANVNPIRITENDEDIEPLIVEGNDICIIVNDANYDVFFNPDGTIKDSLSPDGEYTLFIDTLNNKDIKILEGKNIYIFNKEGAGVINNGTVTIGNGAEIESVQVSGLTINNVNKDAIVVMQNAKNIAIAQNNLNLTYDSSYYDSPMAIVTHGYVDGVTIIGNKINMESAATYTYGIDLTIYLPGWVSGSASATNFYVADNEITIVSTYVPVEYDGYLATGMAEGIYLDTLSNSVVENNTVNVKTISSGVANYGIALADSSNYAGGSSPYDVTIKDNTVYLDANDMTYGITAISQSPVLDGDGNAIAKNIVISANDVTIVSTSGAIGIGAQSNDVLITVNNVNIAADPDNAPQCYLDDVFGGDSCGINVKNFDGEIYFANNTVADNVISSNIAAMKVAEEESASVQPLTVEDNEAYNSYLIDDDSYATYFDANGNIKDDAPITAGDVLLLGDLTNKKLVIDTGLTIRGVPNKKLVNCTINLIQGADNSVIEDLDMEFTGDDTTGSIGIIYIKDVTNVTIQNNKILVPDFVDKTGSKYGSSVYAIEVESGTIGSNDIFINNNFIVMSGSCRYLYGIDVFADSYTVQPIINNVNIFENYVYIEGGSRMAEGIYVTRCNDVIIDGNEIDSTSNGAAYGISTDQNTNIVIASNIIDADAATQAYGITATTSGSDVIIRANEIDAKGTGAVGIGFNKQDGVIIEDNTVAIDGGDYTSITSSDNLGTANAAILEGEGNTNVEMSGNDVTETSTVRLDTVIEASDLNVTAAPSGNGSFKITLKTVSGMLLANQVVKVVFNNQMYELTTDAKGVAVLPFALNKGGTYNVEVFYLGDDDYRGSDASAKITINKVKTALTASNKNFIATASTKALTATLKDANGNVLANKTVTFTVNGKTYKATTNAKGVATVKLALSAAKTYKVTIKFAGDGVYAASSKQVTVKLIKEATKLVAPNKAFKRTLKTKRVIVTLRNSKNKAMAKKVVTLVVNKKRYTVRTNSKGQAIFNVALTKRGTYRYTAKFAGDTQYKAISRNAKIVIR